MSKSFKDWLQEGEELYNQAMKEYQSLQTQIEELETRLTAKKEEVDQIAAVVGKPVAETPRRQAVQIIDPHGQTNSGVATGTVSPSARNTIAKALVGRALNS